jgi:hypothetical protein
MRYSRLNIYYMLGIIVISTTSLMHCEYLKGVWWGEGSVSDQAIPPPIHDI